MKAKKSFGKRILSIVLTMLLVLSLVPLSAIQDFAAELETESVGASIRLYDGVPVTPQKVDAKNYSQLGFTSTNYSEYNGWYAIRDAKEFYGFANLVNNNGEDKAKAVLVNDIVVNETVSSSGAKYSWTPIGSLKDPFEGVLDGRGCTISGIYINGYSEVGLFGCVGKGSEENNPTVKNLVLSNSYISGRYYYVGGIAGRLFGMDTVISKCKIDSNVTIESRFNGEEAYIGGITGHNFGDMLSKKYSQINDCVVLGKVTAPNSLYYIGAIAGRYHDNTIPNIVATNCYYIEGNVTSKKGVINVGLGCKYNQTNNGCTQLKSINDSHTCVGVQRKETVANCLYDGMTEHTFCLICGKVLSGTKTVTQAPHNHLRIDENGFCPDCGGYEQAKQNSDGVYEIDNAGKLYWFAEQINTGALAAHKVKLTADIVIPDSKKWTPINFPDNANNRSVFDGNGHSITMNQYYDKGTTDSGDYGLFSRYNYCIVENLVLKGSITTNTTGNVGAVSANSYRTTFRNIFSYMNVTNNCSTGGNTGGIVGYFGGKHGDGMYSLIENCAVYADITGYTVGGFVGQGWNGTQYYDITNGAYVGDVEGHNAGAIVGYQATDSNTSRFTNIYWCESDNLGFYGLRDTENQIYTNTEAKTAEQFASGEVAYLLGEPFGQKIGTDKYPVFGGDKVYCLYIDCIAGEKIYSNSPEYDGEVNHHYENGFCKGCGSYEPAIDSNNDGYCEIDNAGKLYWYAENINNGRSKYNAILTADITVNDGVVDENSTNARKWTPIGTHNNGYSRTFDGNGKTISGLYFNDSSSNDVGFIYSLSYYGTVKNLNIKNSYFSGNKKVGGIAGASAGKVENCTYSGIVKGKEEVGGIVGDNYIIDALTANCYSSGKVIGDRFVGGVIGYNMGTVKYCYSISEVVAEAGFGVIGYSYNKPVSFCYYLNTSCNGGINGKDIAGQAEAKTAEQFASGEVAYLLGEAFGQKIGTDEIPVLGGDKVYYGYESETATEKIYSNSPLIEKHAQLGDIDLDGKISIVDATLLSKYLVGRVQLNNTQFSISDVNHDDTIDIRDATTLQKIIAGFV